MALTKVLIERKVKPGQEQAFKKLMREVLSGAAHTHGFISGETLQSLSDPSVHVTISLWKDLSSWQDWINSPPRKKIQEEYDKALAEPMKVTTFHYE
ncbi:MAG: antibiotic biosynthesis monooxygenase family protein [Syntrophales bacterium]|jgi:heme-degrading monooxygenase HmoA|nr:antibiotic biosynthesis monooxygenase family protein [Syntrophales bacterium]NLN60933.1 antibiotic biosynthesis monooxygenase [Deltaproteobacteria bacterium]